MNDREKKLLTMLLSVGGILLIFFGYSEYNTRMLEARTKAAKAKADLKTSKTLLASAEAYASDMAWLDKLKAFEPGSRFRKPTQTAQTELQKFATNQAVAVGLTIDKDEIQEADTTGTHFHRVKVLFQVTGKEQALYSWLDRLNSPKDLRTFTYFRVYPNKKDDTQITSLVTAELWYVPDDGSTLSETTDVPPLPTQ